MIKVLIVDDSIVVQRLLTRELGKFPDIQVVGAAVDPYVARERIVELTPDVITLDIEMPRMDGLTFLEKLMKHMPMRVIVVSSLSQEGSETALRALALGAIDVVGKPSSQFSVPDVAGKLVTAIRAAAAAKLRPIAAAAARSPIKGAASSGLRTTGRVLCIGSSTGGTRALEDILPAFPADGPATVIVQHMPSDFTGPFARRLDGLCSMTVREARDGDPVVQGSILVAPGGRHTTVVRNGAHYQIKIEDSGPVQHHRPSVDVLFQSAAKCAGANAMGMLLTGMGSDGARGLGALRMAGARTVAQDEASSVVWGMPRVAIEMGAAEAVLGLDRMSEAALKWWRSGRIDESRASA
jgi:two-component system chemotaxis response regulator CheB